MSCRTDNAVSTIVGAVLILALLIAVAAAAKMVYVPDMKKEAESAHMQNAIDDMQNLKTQVSTLQAVSTTGNGFTASSPLEMGGGSLPLIDPSSSSGTISLEPAYGNFSIAAYSNNRLLTDNSSMIFTRGAAPMGRLFYAANNHYFVDQQIGLEGGMLILSQQGGNAMLASPPISVVRVANDSNTTAIIAANTARIVGPAQTLSSTGESTIRTTVLPAGNVVNSNKVTNVTISVKSSYSQLWYAYFAQMMNASGLVPDTNYKLTQPDTQTVRLWVQGSGYKDDLSLSSVDSQVITQIDGAGTAILPVTTNPAATPVPGGLSPQAPVASISALPTSGSIPLTVTFQGSGTNSPTSYDWTFGDGSDHGSGANVTHTYTTPGTYQVVLVAGNSGGSSAPVVATISVQPLVPVASFTASPSSGMAPLTVSFQGSGTNSPASYDWDFGDGSGHGSGASPTHTYVVPGTYTVTLIARNSAGNSTPYAVQNCITAGTGTKGVMATYYSDEGWTNAAGTETLSEIKEADNAAGSSGYASDKANWPKYVLGKDDQFSARFTGWLNVATEADYTFYLTSDDGSWLTLDGTQVIDNGGLHSPTMKQATVHLTRGYHSLEVKMYEHTGITVAYLEYSSPTMTRQFVQEIYNA